MLARYLVASVTVGVGLMVLGSPTALAGAPGGPSKAQIAKDVKGPDVTRVEPRERGAGATRSEGVWYWEQTVEITHKTAWKGVTKIVRGDVSYAHEGGRWRFRQFRYNSEWYEGLTPPQPEDVAAALKTLGLRALLSNEYQYAVEVHAMTLADEPAWSWGGPNEVTFTVIVEWTTKHDRAIAQRMRDEVRMDLVRAEVGAPWTGLCGTEKGCISGWVGYNHGKEVSRISGAEAEAIRTIAEREKDAWMDEQLAPFGLPAKFEDMRALAAAAWRVLYAGNADAWKAFEQKTGSSHTSASWVLERSDDVKRAYCPELFFEELIEKPHQLEVHNYDKAHEKKCFVRVQPRTGGFKVEAVGCQFPDASRLAALAAIPEAEGCKPRPVKPRPAPEKTAAELGFSVGDKIVSKWHGNGPEYPGTIGEIDGAKVRVLYDDGDKEWVTTTAIRRR